MKIKFTVSVISIFFMFACVQVNKKESSDVSKVELENEYKISKEQNLKKETIQTNTNCFTSTDVNRLKLFLKSLTNGTQDISSNSPFKFREKDFIKLKELLTKESFDFFEIKHENIECDSSIGLFIYFREKFEDGDEINYSETTEIYELTKENDVVKLKFLALLG